jgi:hydrogenase nickel incorporation protein HypA/HybF
MGYAEAILQHALKLAEKKGAKEVKKIRVAVGKLLLINPEQLKFCFSALASSTIAENAELEIEFLDAEGRCTSCGKIFEDVDEIASHTSPHALGAVYTCTCGGLIEFRGGKDFILRSLSLEV